MEFRYRSGEQSGRASSSWMNHFTRQMFEVGIDNGSLSNGPTNIPRKYLLDKIREERMIEERLANEMAQNRMIEEEMLARVIARRRMLEEEMFAKEIARKRMLEEDSMREMEYLNHLPMNNIMEGDYGFDQRLGRGFEKSPFNNQSIKYDDDNGVIGGSDETKVAASKLTGKKRKASTSLPFPAKNGWNCSMCSVTATSRKDFNRHIKGRKHRTKETQLIKKKATPSINSNADFSPEENSANDKTHNKGEKRQYSNKAGWWCKLCEVKCATEATLQYHLAGKKHKTRFNAHKVKDGEVVPNGVNEGGEHEEEDV